MDENVNHVRSLRPYKTTTTTATGTSKNIGLMGKTSTLHVHHAFFVHFFAFSAQLRREMTTF